MQGYDPFDEEQSNSLKKHNLLSSLNFYIRSSIKEAGRRKLYFFLAVCSTLIVVCSTAISQTVIEYAPLIFLKACESNSASIDVTLNPSTVFVETDDGLGSRYESKRLLFNTTRIRNRLSSSYPDVATPRYEFDALLVTPNKGQQGQSCSAASDPPYQHCHKYTTKFILQETNTEHNIGMGNKLPLPEVIPEDSVILSEKQAKDMGVKIGDQIVVQLDLRELFVEAITRYNFQHEDRADRIDTNSLVIMTAYIPVTISDIFETLVGKFPDEAFQSTVIYEYQHFFKTVANHLPERLLDNSNAEKFKRFLKKESASDYASQIIFNIKDRNRVYLDPNFDHIQSSLTNFASKVSKEIGIFPYEMNLPVFNSLYPMRFGALFLGVSLKVIIAILFLLSVIVIYNLLQVTVETKTFEFGVIRMLGLSKVGVAELILIQALFFVLPGVIFGIVCAIPLLEVISSYLETKLHAHIPAYPTPDAMFWSIIVGLLIPIISSYYPMKDALGKNLNLSLDQLRSKTNAVQITIEMDSQKFPWTRVVFAVLSVIFGVSLYIFLPLSMLTFNLGFLLSMFFMILIGIFLGLALLSLNFQYVVERFVTQLFFFWTSSSFRTIILKNLVAHKVRNRQTALMYSLSLGFIIFITVSLNQEINNVAYQIQAMRGSLLTIWNGHGINQQMIENHINEHMSDFIESYAWMTEDLRGFLGRNGYRDVTVSHRGKLYDVDARIIGVSPSIFDATLSQFIKVEKLDEESELPLGEQLYTARGSQSVILGEYFRENLGLTLDPESSLLITMTKGKVSRKEELRVLATMDFAPGFKFSRIPLVKNQDMLISLPTFARLAGEDLQRFEDIPLKKIFFKIKDDDPEKLEKAYESLVQLRSKKYSGFWIWDFNDVKNSLESSQSAITIIFVSVESIVMILSLFSLITSMSTNILEQSKEIAVLRAVGVTKKTLNRLYVAEGFVLVFSSSLFGAMIGATIGWTLSAQRVLFTQLPASFLFPWKDLFVILIVAAISAALSAYYPAKNITDMQIGKIIRHGG